MVKGAFRAQIDVMDRPDRVLTGMNRILAGELEASFVTASCASIDMQARALRYAGAGHPLMLMRKGANGSFRDTGSNGLILGPFADAAYQSIELPIDRGDRMILYTDGILEAENASGEQYGEAALHALLPTSHQLSGEELADSLIKSVHEWSGQGPEVSLDDDLTLIVVDVET